MSRISLEDDFNDIISKAMSGLRITDTELSRKTSVSAEIIRQLSRGQLDETSLPAVAKGLDLDPNALLRSALQLWYPFDVEVEGLALFNTPYHSGMRVNAFLVWDPATKKAAIFDTGTDAFPILDRVEKDGLDVQALFLTHTHPDHIAEAPAIARRLNVPVYSNAREPYEEGETFEVPAQFEVGGLKLSTHSTYGHSKGGTTYVIEGLERPVAIVGDALFAGSMGGGMISYPDALRTNREEIFTLPDNTVLCCGHGPLTTVREEKRNNPFFPEFKPS